MNAYSKIKRAEAGDQSFADRVRHYTDSGISRDMATALVLIEAPLSAIPGGAHATLGARF